MNHFLFNDCRSEDVVAQEAADLGTIVDAKEIDMACKKIADLA
jgi:hypothetical protein